MSFFAACRSLGEQSIAAKIFWKPFHNRMKESQKVAKCDYLDCVYIIASACCNTIKRSVVPKFLSLPICSLKVGTLKWPVVPEF